MIAPFLLPSLAAVLVGLVTAALDERGYGGSLMARMLTGQALPLLLGVVLLFFRSWRRFTVGYWMGLGLVLIVAAGACIALIAAFVNSYN